MDRLGSGGVVGRLGFRVGVSASYRYITQASCSLQLTKMLAARPAGRLQNSIHPWPRPWHGENRVANRPEFFGTVPNSAAVSRVPNGSIRDRLMSRILAFGLCQ